jgi:Ca-activated chloride channel family protein
MNFAYPKILWFGLALLPLLALFFWFTWMRRQELIAQFVQNRALAQLALGVSVVRQKWRRVILLVAVALLLLSMAGPEWGFTWEEAAQRGRDIIVAIDTSRSMLATDVQPDRLTRAKLAALDLLRLGKFDRFGLIAFAGTAFLQCPLTFDDEAFRQSVNILQPGIIPQGGTALAEAIKTARDAFGTDAEENHKILVLFTDGEDHESGVKEAAEGAASAGVRIFTVGVGTPGGELLRVRDEQGNQVYVKDDAGNVVKSRLNEELLREAATAAKGFYLPLQGGNAMDILYQKGLAPLPTSEHSSKLMKRLKEQYYWPLAFGILLLLVEIFIPDEKRASKKSRGNVEKEKEPAPVALAAAIILLAFIPQTHASAAKAQREYNSRQYKSALSEYQELLGKRPNDARLHYNAGAAAYQATKFDEAVKQFQAAASSPDLDLQQQSFYNLGNAEYRVGEADSNPQQRAAIWEEALQHYDAALKLNGQDKDAAFNRDLVKKKLEDLKKQQQQDKNKNNQNDKKDQDKKDQQDQKDKKDNKSDQQQKQDQKNNESDQNKQDKEKSQEQKEKEKQDQQKQQQEQQQQQQNQADQKKQEQQDKKDQANSQQGKDSEKPAKPEGEDSAAQYAQLGKMSPAQAKQLLDAQRNEEKALLFIPQEKKANAQNRVFKDW